MLTLPKACTILMTTLAPLLTPRVWQHAPLLLGGAILVPGQRPVTAALRGMGLAHAPSVHPHHRALNCAVWSGRAGARLLRLLLVSLLAPPGPLSRGLDDPLERRRGAKSRAQGLSREPVRSSHSHGAKARG